MAFTAADYAGDSNFAILEGIPSGATTFTSDKFLTIFATLANTTLDKNQMCINQIRFYLLLIANKN